MTTKTKFIDEKVNEILSLFSTSEPLYTFNAVKTILVGAMVCALIDSSVRKEIDEVE